MTKQEALDLYATGWWESATPHEIASFQMSEEMLCCPFGVFHEALEDALGRPVFTHEMALDRDGIIDELAGHRPTPTLREILELVPPEKRIVVVHS